VTSAANPFGFGYKYPDRVKLQYIAIPRSDVRKAVESSKTPYEWGVEARKYYMQNTYQFPSTQQAPKDDLSLGSGGVRRTPTTRPFAEVQDKIKDQLIEAETDRRTSAILERINSTIAGDWVAYHNTVNPPAARAAPGATNSNTPSGLATSLASIPAPPSSLRIPYNTFEYLQ